MSMNYREELARKSIHFGSAVCPLIYAMTSWTFSFCLATSVMLAFLVIDLLRQYQPRVRALYQRFLGFLMRRHESNRLCGATYVMMAVVLCIVLFPRPIAIAAMLFLSISDALASLVGLAFGRPWWFDKSLQGSGAFLASALVIALLCLPDHRIAAVAGAVTAMLFEAIPIRIGSTKLDDNLLVPLGGGAVMLAISMWL
jgi:dolichol kinase